MKWSERGALLSDGDLLGMNYYVLGLEGTLPKLNQCC